jgi:hypothetical protein
MNAMDLFFRRWSLYALCFQSKRRTNLGVKRLPA